MSTSSIVARLLIVASVAACAGASVQPAQAPASRGRTAPGARGSVIQQGGTSARTRAASVAPAVRFASLESGIAEEINVMRRDPAAYARVLEARLAYYDGNLYRAPSDTIALRTREGVAAVREAIGVLRRQAPLPPLAIAKGMSRAAHDHVADLGPRGAMGHDGSDGSQPWDRVSRYGDWQRTISENITFGPDSPRDVVAGLLVDDGVASRGHRHNLLQPDIRVVGVACGPHRSYRVMCVMDQAGGFVGR